MTPSKIFLYFCLSFIGGIFIGSILLGPEPITCYGLGLIIFGLILISVFWARQKIVVFGFCILCLVFGFWRYQNFSFAESELSNYNDQEEKIILIGIISAEPELKGKSQQLTIEILSEDGPRSNKSRVLVMTDRYPEYQYGDKIKITGYFKSPSEDISGFNYKNYLKKDGIYSVMDWPEIELLERGLGNPVSKTLFSFKNKLKESLNRAMSPPQSGLLEALFFGDENNLSKEWKDKFNLTGTRHITAVSGMNITIISALLFSFLLALGFWRQQAYYISVVLIIFYILMTGAASSAVRAGIMGILFLTAQHLGRVSLAWRAIIFAAVLMLFFNPLLLRFDVGFQLSFLAMLGLIFLQPFFMDFFKKIPDFFQLRYSLTATLSAQIFVLPLLIYNFGRIPLLSPLANILIVPLLPLITILGFVFSLVGIVSQFLGQILSWPAWLLLAYVIKIIDFFSKIPLTSLTLPNIHWLWLVIFYLILGYLAWRIQERQRLKFLNY